MLTTWRQSRTSFEWSNSDDDHREESTGKKKKKKIPTTTTNPSDVASFGVHFVHPCNSLHNNNNNNNRANISSLPISSNHTHKRRKLNNDTTKHISSSPATSKSSSGRASDTTEPYICLTSPYRVIFMDKQRGGEGPSSVSGSSGGSNNGNLIIESKTRNYIARPGTSSRFSLRGSSNTVNIVRQQQQSNDSIKEEEDDTTLAFSGMAPLGAQYDPSSNLIYALRNGGANVAIWTAAPSSTIPGPDDDIVDNHQQGGNRAGFEGKRKSGGGFINGGGGKLVNGKKHKVPYQLGDFGSSVDAVISIRLPLPEGKVAVTLTPFALPTAMGAAGCCDDGSIWVAIRFHINETCGPFHILVVDGSSIIEGMTEIGAKSNPKSAKRKQSVDGANSWSLLDSRATGTIDKGSVLLTIKSVIQSKDTAQVTLRHHQIRIENKINDEHHALSRIERCVMQNILHLKTSECDVAVKFDLDSLLVVHKEKDDRWMCTSINLSDSDDAMINSTGTFPVPVDRMKVSTIFSFGRVGKDMVAVLTRGRLNDSAIVMSLSIIDIRRKAELSSVSWVEGDNPMMYDTASLFKDNRLSKMLNNRPCRAMITNELDGSIALLTSSSVDKSFVVMYSKVQVSTTTSVQTAPQDSTFTPLSTALRLVATSSTLPLKSKVLIPIAGVSFEITGVSSAKYESIVNQRALYDGDGIRAACDFLASSAAELIEHARNNVGSGSLITNGKRKKVSNARDANPLSISWKEVYQDCCKMITRPKGGNIDHCTSPRKVSETDKINGHHHTGTAGVGLSSKLDISNGIPKCFIEVVFKESVALLISLYRIRAKNPEGIVKIVQDVTCVLLEVLQTNHISARTDYGVGSLHGDHVFVSILRACSSVYLTGAESRSVGKLHVLDAMLRHVLDIPESALVSILSLMIRSVSVDDVVAYYSSTSKTYKKVTTLSNRYKALPEKLEEDERGQIATKLLSEAILDFTSKIVTYSVCNHSFLTKAMRDSIKSSGEVETMLLTLSKLLKIGSSRLKLKEGEETSMQVNISSGAIQWITALTDAHMGAISKITNDGGLIIDRIHRAVRSAMAQSEFANELRKISDLVMMRELTTKIAVPQTVIRNPKATDTAIVPYTVERLAF